MQLVPIQNKIYEIRGQTVMLDFDLAALYKVETRVLEQAVRRNLNRFPSDFMFELTRNEYNSLRSQIVTLDVKGRVSTANIPISPLRSMESQYTVVLSVIANSTA